MPEPSDVPAPALQRRVTWLEAATIVSRAVLDDSGADVARVATSAALDAADADVASLVLGAADPTELTNVVSVGLGADVYQDVTFLARDSALGRAIVAGEPTVVAQILPWATDHDDPPNPLRLGPAMTVPVHDRHGRNAAFVLTRTADGAPFAAEEPVYAAPFAALVSVALARGRSARDRAVQALHDDLAQRLFAIGVGLQSVIELGGAPESTRRLRDYVGELDEMIALLRADGPPVPPV